MDDAKHITTPLSDATVDDLRAGDAVLISGVIYGARDAAHARMADALHRGDALPFDPVGQVIYYVGPAPPRPGAAVGSAGPTTSGRMDRYAPALHAAGIRGTIGKGFRSREVRDALIEHRSVYFAALGGSGALLARCIKAAEAIAYPELGPEAVYRLVVENFPAIVVNDASGRDLYEEAQVRYRIDLESPPIR
jgi:fumarate hydratase subunit beta